MHLNAAQRAFHIATIELLHYLAQHPDPSRDKGCKAVESVLLDVIVSRERAQADDICVHPEDGGFKARLTVCGPIDEKTASLTGGRCEVGAKGRRSHQHLQRMRHPGGRLVLLARQGEDSEYEKGGGK